jgi:integrase
MAKRRGNKEGTIYKRKDGRWCAQVSLDGRRLTKYGKTQGEVREWLKEIQAQIDSGLTINGARATMEDYLKQWLEAIKPVLRYKTWQQHEQIVRTYIAPHLGTMRLKDLRPEHVQSLYAAHRKAGVGARTIRQVHTTLRRSFEMALKWGLIPRNPCDAVDKPRVETKEMRTLDSQQVRALLKATEGHRNEALYYLAVTTGMRLGELLGLCWSNVDWETGRLRIQRQAQPQRGGMVLTELKSASSRRQITLGPVALEKLRERRERYELERLVADERWQEHDLVFPSRKGTPRYPSNLRNEYAVLLREAGLPHIRFHDLRHTAATLMLQQGVHPKVVQERLGHSSVTLTLQIYSHVLPSLHEEVANQLDRFLLQ